MLTETEREVWRFYDAGFEDGGRGHKLKNVMNVVLEAEKWFFPRATKGSTALPWGHLTPWF